MGKFNIWRAKLLHQIPQLRFVLNTHWINYLNVWISGVLKANDCTNEITWQFIIPFLKVCGWDFFKWNHFKIHSSIYCRKMEIIDILMNLMGVTFRGELIFSIEYSIVACNNDNNCTHQCHTIWPKKCTFIIEISASDAVNFSVERSSDQDSLESQWKTTYGYFDVSFEISSNWKCWTSKWHLIGNIVKKIRKWIRILNSV